MWLYSSWSGLCSGLAVTDSFITDRHLTLPSAHLFPALKVEQPAWKNVLLCFR